MDHDLMYVVINGEAIMIEIDTVDAPQQPIVYFRKEGKCKTAKGMERQHNRIVNETVEEWRQFSEQIRRYTISRVPASEYVAA